MSHLSLCEQVQPSRACWTQLNLHVDNPLGEVPSGIIRSLLDTFNFSLIILIYMYLVFIRILCILWEITN